MYRWSLIIGPFGIAAKRGEAMTDEQLLDKITEIVNLPDHPGAQTAVHALIRAHRQVGWRRRFTATTERRRKA